MFIPTAAGRTVQTSFKLEGKQTLMAKVLYAWHTRLQAPSTIESIIRPI
jgi:hypothetical protein